MDYPEFLDLVVQLIRKNPKPDNGIITAAALGGLLQIAAPDVNWKMFGKRSLLEVLQDLAANGRVNLTKTDKGALAVALTDQAVKVATPQTATFNPLRKAIWEAFVLTAPTGRRFIHRTNGSVRAGLDVAPTPADEWIEITPISSSTQMEWAREFLATQPEDQLGAARQLFSSGDWTAQQFGTLLREADESAARSWNLYRSSRVSAEVQKWFTGESLPNEWAFQQQTPAVQAGQSHSREFLIDSLSKEETKRIILAALADLPVENLLEIPIPAGILLTAITTAKAR